MDRRGIGVPIRLRDAAALEEGTSAGLREFESAAAAAVQEIGVVSGCDQRDAGVHALRLGIVWRKSPGVAQGRNADAVHAWKSACSLDPGATRTEALPRVFRFVVGDGSDITIL